MIDIETYMLDILSQHHSIDMAEADFKKFVAEDSQLRQAYRDWCHSVGNSERMGFRDFCSEYLANQDSVWDSLTNYDEQ